jgi:CubicO group peptidase (beta-lactamase class C family)
LNPFGVLDEPLLFQPGTGFCYSTFGYNFLGAVLENATRSRFIDFLKNHIFLPLGMRSTGIDFPSEGVKIDATPYVRDTLRNIQIAPEIDVRWKVPGGGLASNALDLTRFAQGLMSGRILSEGKLRRMSDPVHVGELARDYGLGFHVWKSADESVWLGHGGAATGGTAYLLMNPRFKFSVVLLTNLQFPAAELRDLAQKISGVYSMPLFEIPKKKE